MQDQSADELDIVVTETDGALGSLTHKGESLRQDVLERSCSAA